MKRIAQTQDKYNDDSAEQSVMLSPRTLLTGPRQIVRLERQYRSLSEDLQNSLENLNRTKDSYVNALQAFEQAEAYMRQLGPRVKMAMESLKVARTNPQYIDRAELAINEIVSTTAPAAKTAQTTTQTRLAHGAADAALYNAEQKAAVNPTTPSAATGTPNAQQQAMIAQQQAMAAQQINTLQTQLNTFVGEMYRRYNMHKQRVANMEGQYNMSKGEYAKIRAQFFQMQSEISALSSNLSGWNERLSEFYMPNGGEA